MLPASVEFMTSHDERRAIRTLRINAPAWFFFIVLISAAQIAVALPQQKSGGPPQAIGEPVRLEPLQPIEKALSGGEFHSYGVQAEEGQFLYATVEQLGIHVALAVYGPDRKLVALMANPNRTTGLQQISAIAKQKGTYKLEITSDDKDAPPGRYRVSIEEPRAPTPADRARVSAERAFQSGVDSYQTGTTGASNRAASKFEDSMQLWRNAGDVYEESMTFYMFGKIYLRLGARKQALDEFNQALPLMHSLGDVPGEAEIRNQIGAVYEENGEKEKALDQFTATLAFERDFGEQTFQAETLAYMGMVHIELGQASEALLDFEQALFLVRQSGDQRDLPRALKNVGDAYDDLGEKQKALDYYSQALPSERASNDRVGESEALNNIGMVDDDLGDRHAALDNYRQALQIDLQLHALDVEAATRNNIAAVYDELGEKRKALTFYHRALSILRKLKDIAGEATALNNIGFVYHNLGQDRKALSYYNRALPVFRAVEDRGGVAMALHNIGVAEDRLGRRQEGLSNLNESLLLFQEVQDPLGQGLTLGDLMSHFRDTGNPNSGIFFGKEAINAYQQVRRNITGLPSNLQKSFVASKESTYRELADLLITQGRLREAEQVLGLLKQAEYFEFIRGGDGDVSSATVPLPFDERESEVHRLYKENPDSIVAKANEYALLSDKQDRTPEASQLMNTLNEQLMAAMDKFEEDCSDLDRVKATNPGSLTPGYHETVSQITNTLKRLDPKTVALYTLVGEKDYRIILVTTNRTLDGHFPIGRVELRRKVLEFRQALQDTSRNPEPLARELYDILLGPVASELKGAGATTLMWSLDDELRYLPIAALHDGHDYLVAKYRNEVFTPASIPNLADHPNVKTWSGLGMGVSKAYPPFGSLPSVPEELHRIIREKDSPEGEGVMAGRTMIDEAFTKDNMETALEGKYPLVHIASHFDFEGNDTNSFLLLGGAGPEGERLTLHEIRRNPAFKFKGTELLTLSACDTAMGGSDRDGREVDGLGFLAQQMGAQAVVASLWAVNDKSTGVLMQEFYHLWTTSADDMPKVEALRQAQLKMLRGELNLPDGSEGEHRGVRLAHSPVHSEYQGYSHPYYWAPFILIGNWQ